MKGGCIDFTQCAAKHSRNQSKKSLWETFVTGAWLTPCVVLVPDRAVKAGLVHRIDLGFGGGTGVPHVEDDFPVSIFLQLPDTGVLSMLDSGLAVFVVRAKFKGDRKS